jgi:hypothetical protein
MYSPPVKSSPATLKNRLGLKLTALFAASFLTVFIGLLFWDLLLSTGEGVLVDAAASNQSAVTRIDPKIESDLAKVLESNDAQNTADIKNPFADQSGISDKFSITVSSTTATPANASSTKPVNASAVPNNPQKNQAQQNVAAKSVPNSASVNPLEARQMDTKTRLQIREERIRLGEDGGPESVAFAVDDLLPVGVVSGGDGKEEVMFYSESACRVFSFPVGTQFYDGWFDSTRPEGVVFGFFDQYRTRRMRAWGRSVKTGCSENLSITTMSDQPVITGGSN